MMAMSQAHIPELMREGVAFARNGERQRAEERFREVIALDERHEQAWLWLAGLTEEPAESLLALERTLQINPNNPLALAQIKAARLEAGIAAVHADEKEVARELLQQACNDDPTNEHAWLWLAGVTDDPKQATAHLKHVLRLNPNSEPAKAGLENWRRRQQTHATSTVPAIPKWYCPVCLAKAENRFVTCGVCRSVLSLSKADLALSNPNPNRDRIRTGITRLMGLVRNKPDYATYYYLGMAFLNLNQIDDALVQFQAALRIKSDDEGFVHHVAMLQQRRQTIRIVSDGDTPTPVEKPKKKCILVVDDSPTIRKLIGMTMSKNGYQIIEAEDGNEALEKIQMHGVPDVVLLDVSMPGMDGYAVCKIMRQNPQMAETPVIMLSGKDGFFNKIRSKMAGSTMFLSKPFQPEGLLRAVQTYCPVAAQPTKLGQ
jgi:twitching motility two-component system response regulator PilG